MLDRLGGAATDRREPCARRARRLTPSEQAIASSMFFFLVTARGRRSLARPTSRVDEDRVGHCRTRQALPRRRWSHSAPGHLRPATADRCGTSLRRARGTILDWRLGYEQGRRVATQCGGCFASASPALLSRSSPRSGSGFSSSEATPSERRGRLIARWPRRRPVRPPVVSTVRCSWRSRHTGRDRLPGFERDGRRARSPKLSDVRRFSAAAASACVRSPSARIVNVRIRGLRQHVRLWDLRAGALGHPARELGQVWFVAFGPSGRTLAVAGSTGRCGCGTCVRAPSSLRSGRSPGAVGLSRSARGRCSPLRATTARLASRSARSSRSESRSARTLTASSRSPST